MMGNEKEMQKLYGFKGHPDMRIDIIGNMFNLIIL